MNQYSKLSIPKSTIEKVHDWICMFVIVGVLGYIIYSLFKISGTITTHFNAEGQVDHKGSKWSILMPYGMMLLMYFLFSFIQKHPEWANFPGPRIKENYRTVRIIMSWVKLEVILLFVYIIWSSIQGSMGGTSGLGVWFLPVSGVGFALTIVISIFRLKRGKG